MTKADFCKLRPTDLRRIAAQTPEPERERKMLALAEKLEEEDRRVRPERKNDMNYQVDPTSASGTPLESQIAPRMSDPRSRTDPIFARSKRD